MTEAPEFEWRDQVSCLIQPALRLAIRLCGDRQAAEDSVQEALVKLARYGAAFQGQAQLSTYFTRIVINACNDMVARQRRQQGASLDDCSIAGPKAVEPEFANEQVEQVGRIRDAVNSLPQRQRTVLILNVWEHQTPEKIAELLEMNIQNVYSTLSIARKQLRQILKHESAE